MSDYPVSAINYAKLGWHKRQIVREAYENGGEYSYLFADNNQLRQLIAWGWLIKVDEWGKYKLTIQGEIAYKSTLKVKETTS